MLEKGTSWRRGIEDMKMKGRFQEEPMMESEPRRGDIDPLLDLRLSSNGVDFESSKLELNLLGQLDSSESPIAPKSSIRAKMVGKQSYFLCRYCNKKFSNSQALGGHQNAHKRERALLRGDKVLDFVPYGYMDIGNGLMYPLAAMAGFPALNKPLGINMHSPMIHKSRPFCSWNRSGAAYNGLEGSSRQAVMNQQVNMHDNLWTTNGAFPTLDTMRFCRVAPFGSLQGSSLGNLSAAATATATASTEARFDGHVDLSGGVISTDQPSDVAAHDISLNLRI